MNRQVFDELMGYMRAHRDVVNKTLTVCEDIKAAVNTLECQALYTMDND